jgi:hypothetical protein
MLNVYHVLAAIAGPADVVAELDAVSYIQVESVAFPEVHPVEFVYRTPTNPVSASVLEFLNPIFNLISAKLAGVLNLKTDP